MSNYFDNFPLVQYQNHTARDISRRIKFSDHYDDYDSIILPYTVEDGQKPEDISYYYYGTVDYTWLVCLLNDVIDTYNDWVLSSSDFEKMMIAKYTEQSGERGYDVIAWSMNTTLFENIVHFEKDGLQYSPESVFIDTVAPENFSKITASKTAQKNLSSMTSFGDYKAIRIYDYEQRANESKRNIILIDKAVVKKVVKDFKDIIIK